MTVPNIGVQLRPNDPTWLGDYELLERLGEGGMGVVFRGRSSTGRMVAIKVVRTDFLAMDEYRQRFRSEVNRARQVPPFCTAEVLDADLDHDPPYLVVEYVDGPSLASVIRNEGPLQSNDVRSVAIGIATALSAIHGAGVVHRDLKPDNVLLARGGPKVIDFGIARPLEVTSNHTRTNQMVGTIAYMAPERFAENAHQKMTPAIDVFAWGVLVAYAATGRTPFAADSGPAMAVRIITQPPDLGALSEPLRSIVAHTLEKDPADRPTTHELLEMLTAVDSKGQMLLQPTRRRDSTRRAPGSRPDPVQGSRPDQGGRRAAAKRWSAIVVAGLAAASLTTLITQGFLDNTIDKADSTTEPPASASAAATAAAGTGAKATGVFGGERRTVLHLAEVDRNLYLDRAGELAAHETADARSEFALVPAQSGHVIEALAAAASGERQCLRVEPQEDDAGPITLGGCAPDTATRFDLVPTGKRDTHGHPTFTIHDETNGAVEWSSVRSQLYLKPKGDTPVGTTVSFADRGPLR